MRGNHNKYFFNRFFLFKAIIIYRPENKKCFKFSAGNFLVVPKKQKKNK